MDEKNDNSRKWVGKVTEEERDEIQSLFERKNGLIELTRSLTNMEKKDLESSALYEKLVTDMGKVSTKFQKWWDEKSMKYNWENVQGYHWQIDFETCNIYLVKG
ncbi:MAG: CXXX repeat peptide modification system protein [Candidatus Omnitrophota bacterium]